MIYEGKYTKEISFPLGGIGSGCIGLDGKGRLIDWEIFNRPSKGSRNGYSHIAVKAKNKNGVFTRVLNGDMDKDYIGQYMCMDFRGFGYGPENTSLCGFPHFSDLSFKGEFPIAEINFKDEKFPAQIKLTAFNPFIPLDDKNSSIPGAFFEIEVHNEDGEETEYQVAFSLQNPFEVSSNKFEEKDGISLINFKNAGAEETDTKYGDLTIATDCKDTLHQTYWYRGEWQDAIVSFWTDFCSEKDLTERSYPDTGNKDTGTLVAKVTAKPYETVKVRFILTWNVPNNYNYWEPYRDSDGKDITWKNYYATVFKDSIHSAEYSLNNWDGLYNRTLSFKDAIHQSTLDKTIIDAVSANLSVLKSPTVLRLEDGSFYGWEGVHQNAGSCEGTCQHVWNYAYALCFLFPKLERSIRNAELKYALFDSGRTVFRIWLPYGREAWDFRACVDGQMGTIIKIYREWKISGDNDWLKEIWENIKKMLEYAWSDENPDKWDADKDGILEGRQHHTLDMELFGPSSWLESMYLSALKAAAEMAEALGDTDKEKEYKKLFENGYNWTKDNLFNGEYFIHKLDVTNKDVLAPYDAEDRYWNSEKGEIKYQICDGCEIDQMLGQWHSQIVGLGNVLDKGQVKTALKSIMKNNFKESMRDFLNPWRIFCLNDEAGTIICEYPDGVSKPVIPVPYSEETMTGLEYQFAGLLIANGMIDEGIKVVKAVRDRYDGNKRNPWNEIECGSNYARSMASFALMPIFGGFEFDMPNHHIGFNPVITPDNFKCFWSLESAWGVFKTQNGTAVLEIIEGDLKLSSFGVKFANNVTSLSADGKKIDFKLKNNTLTFEELQVNKCMEICYEKLENINV